MRIPKKNDEDIFSSRHTTDVISQWIYPMYSSQCKNLFWLGLVLLIIEVVVSMKCDLTWKMRKIGDKNLVDDVASSVLLLN